MITYVNEKNAIKYQVLFDKAAQALNETSASGGTTTISSLPEYFANIGDLAKLKSKAVFLRIPLDEEPFEIDLDTRTINIPASFAKNGIAVKGDQVAEIVYFKVNRFFDAQDLSNTDIYIEWSTGKARGISKAFCVDHSSLAGYIIFGWAITSAMTKDGNATLTFAPRFVLKADNSSEDSVKFKYSLSTIPYSVKISDTLDLSNIEDVDVDTTDADLIFSRIVNSDLEGDDIIYIDLDGDSFAWVLEPATSDETAQIWFRNSEDVEDGGRVGKTVYAQARTTEGYLSYRWEMLNGTDRWTGVNNNSDTEEDLGVPGDMQLAFDYTLFREYTPVANDQVPKAYYEMYDTPPANQVSYPGHTASDPDNTKYFVRLDETPSGSGTYYIVQTGDSSDGYGQILSGINYWYRAEDGPAYISLSEVDGLDFDENFRPNGSFVGVNVETALMPYGKIYTMRTSYTITDPGTYRVKAIVSQKDNENNKKIVASIYSSHNLTAAVPEEIPTAKIGNLEEFNIAVSSEVEENSVYYDESLSTVEGGTSLVEINHDNIAKSQRLEVSNPQNLESEYCHGVGTIKYKWCKDGEEIAGANESSYTATEPGQYTVKVGNAINNRTTWHNDETNIANITSLPSIPTVALTGTSTIVDDEGSYSVGETLTVAISSDLETEGLYFAWKEMIINPSMEGSIDLNIEENDDIKWTDGNRLLPGKSPVGTWTSTFTPTKSGFYYCLVYNSLNGILSSPLKVGNFRIVE